MISLLSDKQIFASLDTRFYPNTTILAATRAILVLTCFWHVFDLERVQKSALRVILKEKYKDYKNALLTLNIESLYDRRESTCLKFAKKGLKLEQLKKLFPIQKSSHCMEKRSSNKFIVNSARTERYSRSSIPSMQRILNSYEKDLKKALRVMPVPNELYPCDSLVVKF